MEKNSVIEVHEVHKKFKNYNDKSNNLKEKFLHYNRNKYQWFEVLQGISFDIKRGEAIGIVGRNGCGKSTLLKLLTKIIYPDRGSIEVRGRVSSLLELGAGFHPDLSGYENIYLNASVFGLTRNEIKKREHNIIRFSELGDFINNPIRTYSSGMYMKLAFSVAINVDADILLIDEILGVGDVSFQKKCFEKLLEIKQRGTTIVIVSHSTNQIEKICDRSIWIEQGRIKMTGSPKNVHEQYLKIMEDDRILRNKKEAEEREQERIEKERANQERLQRETEEKLRREKEEKLQKEREKIEYIASKSKKKRSQERKELAKRKKERELLRHQNSIIETGASNILNIKVMEEEEKSKQKILIEKAKEARQEQAIIVDTINVDEVPEEKKGIVFFKKEANRLELVVKEKNIEIERLNSVIKQKELILEKQNSNIQDEILRLNQVIVEKEDEIDRLNEVILGNHEEIDRLDIVIMQKDVEIDAYRKSLIENNS